MQRLRFAKVKRCRGPQSRMLRVRGLRLQELGLRVEYTASDKGIELVDGISPLNPEPETPNPTPPTLSPRPGNPKLYASNPRPSTMSLRNARYEL